MIKLEAILVLLLGVVVTHWCAQALRGRLALPIIQIAIGALIGLKTGLSLQLEPELFFVLFLPPLLFLDGWRIPTEDLKKSAATVLSLAFGLVFFTVLGVGLLLHLLIPPMPLSVCFALAAVLSPTDVVAAGAMMANIKVPQRMLRILEGEALFNDASGLVCLKLATSATLTGAFSLWDSVGTLAWTAICGVAIGAASTVLVSRTKSWMASRLGEETPSQILISLLTPYGAYLIADQLGCSAVLAAVTAGIVMSKLEIGGIVLPVTRVSRRSVWETLQFTLNGVIFLLLGEQLPGILTHLSASMTEDGHRGVGWLGFYIASVTLALAALRFVWVWVTGAIWLARQSQPGKRRLDPNWRFVAAMSTAGVRGAITLAGALSLPLVLPDGSPFPARDLVISIAAGVIIASLVFANLTLPVLLRGLRLPAAAPDGREESAARIQSAQAALAALAKARGQNTKQPEGFLAAAAGIAEQYQRRITQLRPETTVDADGATIDIREALQHEQSLRLLAIKAERAAIIGMARQSQISDSLAKRMLRETDLAETSYDAASEAV
ncbi:Na+/H+ antiporter [Kaistia dalseonensis]|uniref:CPA1 family monovalent cation:H+ antiporter n=1 Tax=Kaistia dalseonensis TaxID=410840 RepID=A0ABU0H9L3_9HYPH|nr:Na+/H+ antiporter [Kaistia dalseonensis]MCX5496082.1 Na+/H+ antiporter [Kaistia dalseonensis]MDQ0438687.1 CPA1 family monovalent cation:H+ antiporter [Kaistia dalseonensis]